MAEEEPQEPAEYPLATHETYGRWYSPKRLMQKLGWVAGRAGKAGLQSALMLYYCMKDPETPKKAKLVILGALGYLILPTDLLPDLLPMVGLTDDWGAIAAAVAAVAAYIKDEHKQLARVKAQELLSKAKRKKK